MNTKGPCLLFVASARTLATKGAAIDSDFVLNAYMPTDLSIMIL